MNKIRNLLLAYNVFILTAMIFVGFSGTNLINNLIFVLFFIPVEAFFISEILNKLKINNIKILNKKRFLKSLFIYSFIFINILFVSVIGNILSYRDLLFVLILLPLELYILFLCISKINKSLNSRKKSKIITDEDIFNFKTEDVVDLKEYNEVKEIDKRKFFKLIAGAGLGVFITMILNPQKAGAAFFGSVPGPGTVGVKDSAGDLIDPAIKSPTDGYGIMNVDDDGTYPNYYGYVNKDGAWYIVKEASDGSFTYAKGASGYNFSNRASETYGTFDSTF